MGKNDRKDDTFDKVMKGFKSTRGDSNDKRAEQDKRAELGRRQAANDRIRRETQAKIANKTQRGNR